MANASSFSLHPFALLEWWPRTRAAPVAGSAPAEGSYPVCAGRLGGFVGSLWRVCDRVTASTLARQQLLFRCVVTGEPPVPQLDVLIRLATLLITDAADACAGSDAACSIGVLVERQPHQVVLSVEHDGWPCHTAVRGDRSLAWVRPIVAASGGKLSRQIDWDRTVTRVELPRPGRHST